MLEATRRKIYADSRGGTLNLTEDADVDDDDEGHDTSSSADSSLQEGEFPSTFPNELRTIFVPAHWNPSYWTCFLWFGSPCEYLYEGRSEHPQLNLATSNGPDMDEDEKITVKKEGAQSLSRASQKRKANSEAASENGSVTSSESSECTKVNPAERELDLAERVQTCEEPHIVEREPGRCRHYP